LAVSLVTEVPAREQHAGAAADRNKPAPSVTLCVPTYRRPEGLATLLRHVARLIYTGPLSVLVVDNDASRCEGITVVRSLQAAFPFKLDWAIESVRGQTYAYNRCFTLACRSAETPQYVAVLDDDEFPDPNWLGRMVAAASDFDADIVGGPVFPVFAEADHWLVKTGLYDPRRYSRGPVPIIYGAGSMLIRRVVLAGYLDQPFSNEYAFTGGSDLDFFRRCQDDGHKFAWADDAHVFETIPTSRLTVAWLLKRAFRSGTDLTRTDKRCAGARSSAALRWIKGLGLIAAGIGSVPLSASRGRAQVIRSLFTAARGAGRIAAEFNVLHQEYR
jgi:glycosyltransferase involved in cell wall biosynthesis